MLVFLWMQGVIPLSFIFLSLTLLLEPGASCRLYSVILQLGEALSLHPQQERPVT